MSKATVNKIAATDSLTAIQAATTTVNDLTNSLSFLRPLTDDDVKGSNKISDGDKVFITDCLTESPNATDLMPSYYDEQEIRNNNLEHDALYQLEDKLFELYQNVRRNRMYVGGNAYSGVSTFYELIKAAAKTKSVKAIAMFNRLKSYHMKKVETAKANKKKKEAEKANALANAAEVKTVD
jgi:hypothetical protein